MWHLACARDNLQTLQTMPPLPPYMPDHRCFSRFLQGWSKLRPARGSLRVSIISTAPAELSRVCPSLAAIASRGSTDVRGRHYNEPTRFHHGNLGLTQPRRITGFDRVAKARWSSSVFGGTRGSGILRHPGVPRWSALIHSHDPLRVNGRRHPLSHLFSGFCSLGRGGAELVFSSVQFSDAGLLLS